MTSIGISLSQKEAFFGCPFDQVNSTIQLMVMYSEEGDPLPDWLRGISKFSELPRLSEERFGNAISVSLLRKRDIAARVKWIIEYLDDEWYLDIDGFSFKEMTCAVHYKIRWGGVITTERPKLRLRAVG